LSSFSTNNTYHALSKIDSPGNPHACSSPIAHQAKKGSSEIKVKNRIQRPSKIVNINFQSIKNKKPELDILLDTTKPDVIIGTETWLDSTISSYEYFPQDQYTVYRTDRPPNKQGQSHGGVLIAVTNEFLSNEAKELKTNCEMVWAELTISNARKCQICAYYRPHPEDDISLQLEPSSQSLSRINPSSKSVILLEEILTLAIWIGKH
jgi:hypothetical protein